MILVYEENVRKEGEGEEGRKDPKKKKKEEKEITKYPGKGREEIRNKWEADEELEEERREGR